MNHAAGAETALGALVRSPSSIEIGLVVVCRTTGRVKYWESTDNADALSLLDRHRHGIEGSIMGLYSGEYVVRMEDADYSGFVLTLNTGRIVHLSLRDGQSQPAIAARYMTARGPDASASGVFGSLRSVFGGVNWLKDITSTKSRPSRTRGHVDVVIASGSATFQVWQVSWSGQAVFQKEIAAKTAIESTVRTSLGSELYETRVVDFEFAGQSNVFKVEAEDVVDQDIIVLIAITGATSSNFAIAELEIRGQDTTVKRLLPLRSYTPPLLSNPSWKPRLCFPAPYHTAFAVFEKAIVLISLATIALSAESQLFMDTNKLPEPYQDTIFFRDDKDVHVIGACAEQGVGAGRHSRVVLFAKDCGVVRISAVEPSDDNKAVERAHITVKSKIEQAIFYGNIPDNPLNLSKTPQTGVISQELETAALEISAQILTSTTPFVVDAALSTEAHLAFRAQALENLALHLKHAYPSLSRQTRWQLLANAEKLTAAQQVWLAYDHSQKTSPSTFRFLPELINLLHERHKTELKPASGEHDQVRQWFTKDVSNIGIILAFAGKAITELYGNDIKNAVMLLQIVSDADDLILAGLGTAFKIREEKAWLYNLEDERIKGGVLQTGHGDLPEFWTSSYNMMQRISALVNSVRDTAADVFEIDNNPTGTVSFLVNKIAEENDRLVELSCKIYDERLRWYAAQENETCHTEGENLGAEFRRERYIMITKLSKIGMVKKGMRLAEEHRDMHALVSLVQEESDFLQSSIADGTLDSEALDAAHEQMTALAARVHGYFEEFGAAWTDAFFSNHIRNGNYTKVLHYGSDWSSEVTRFLQANPKREKLSWIHEVQTGKDYAGACKSLIDVAEAHETNLWSKNVELSLAKLALAAAQVDDRNTAGQDSQHGSLERASNLVRVQKKLYAHVKPSLYNAMDETAELQLAIEAFGKTIVKGRTACQPLLERGMENLVNHAAMAPEQLIDVLTLMDPQRSELSQSDILDELFCLAFQALRNSGLEQTNKEAYDTLLKVVWRRCFTRDKWETLNHTAQKSDEAIARELEATTLWKTIAHGHSICKSCLPDPRDFC